MHGLLLRLEPIIWLLFGQGILIGTMLLTPWILVVGLLVPLGIVDAEALSYERAHALGSNPFGRLILLALCALPLWKGAHHLRSLSIDFGGRSRNADRRSIHCSSSWRRCTSTSVLTPRCAMSQAAITVLPNAVVAASTPVSCASIAFAAACCPVRNSP